MVGQDVCLMPFLFSPHQPFEKTGPKPQVLLQVSSRLIPKQGCSRLALCLLEHRISSEGHSIFMGTKGTMMVNNPLVRPVFSGVALGGGFSPLDSHETKGPGDLSRILDQKTLAFPMFFGCKRLRWQFLIR